MTVLHASSCLISPQSLPPAHSGWEDKRKCALCINFTSSISVWVECQLWQATTIVRSGSFFVQKTSEKVRWHTHKNHLALRKRRRRTRSGAQVLCFIDSDHFSDGEWTLETSAVLRSTRRLVQCSSETCEHKNAFRTRSKLVQHAQVNAFHFKRWLGARIHYVPPTRSSQVAIVILLFLLE